MLSVLFRLSLLNVLSFQFGSASLVGGCDAVGHGECRVQGESVLLQKQHLMKKTITKEARDQSSAGSMQETAILGSDSCRFAKLEWPNLLTDESVQNAYMAATLRWDGKFAAPGAASSLQGMTRDHIALHDDGSVKRIAGYTAPSKENLHISMLAVVLDGASPVAWNFLIDSLPDGVKAEERGLSTLELKALAEAEALRRLENIIGEYERWRQMCPGCGGFMNWIWVGDEGWIEQPGNKVKAVPGLDNGQMVWSLIAAAQVLKEKGHMDLAARFQQHIDEMAEAVSTLFIGPSQKRSAARVNIKEKTEAVGAGLIAQKGMLRDPFEGELMIMFQDLLGHGVTDKAKEKLWKKVRRGVLRKEYTGPRERSDCVSPAITVESGWRFSAHEEWKYLVLPYLDNDVARRVFENGERARAWDAHCRELPGFMAACYRPPHTAGGEPVYMDTLGVEPISYGYTEPTRSDLVVTPYGSFPLILVNRGQGLAWHQSLLTRPRMQSQYGSMDASDAFPPAGTPPRVASIMTWDTKVTTDLAMSGGTVDILRRFLEQNNLLERFNAIVSDQMSIFGDLSGEEHDWPDVHKVYSGPGDGDDFEDCTV